MSETPSSDTTVLQPGIALPAQHSGSHPLPIGHYVQEYVVQALVGLGGFGIVYLARDTRLGRTVALKEYMPSALALRAQDHHVMLRSERHRETFDLGLRSFVNEAQLLAAFDQPSLVKVYRFWEENGTAYMVMPFYEGPTLKQWATEHTAPTQAWLQALLSPLMDALQVMHQQQCYHRDIAPDNIVLLNVPAQQSSTQQQMPRPVLLDFGAARQIIGDNAQSFTVIIKPGYAPIEQYADSESGTIKQGPWTDVYALCAVLYFCMVGKAPPPSANRLLSDGLVPAVDAGAGRYSPAFLKVIDQGLALHPEQRPQDMAALRALFDDARQELPLGGDLQPIQQQLAQAMQPAFLSSPAATPRRWPWVLAGTCALCLGGFAWWPGNQSESTPSQAEAVQTVISPSDVLAPISGSIPDPLPVLPVLPAASFSVHSALQDLVKSASAAIQVQAQTDKSTVRIGKDRLAFRVQSSQAGYVYVLLSGTDKSHLSLLFPNAIDSHNQIKAGQTLVLPRKNWRITAAGPSGVNHLLVMVSSSARDFSRLMDTHKKPQAIAEFDLQLAEQLWREQPSNSKNPLAGRVRCGTDGDCPADFGATLLEIEEVADIPSP
jgi:serine/threonine protein kinase